MPKGCPLKNCSITIQLLCATRPNIRLSRAVPIITFNLSIDCSWRAMDQGQKCVLFLGVRRVASIRFPKNRRQKIIAAKKKTNNLVFRIVV